MQRLDAEPRAKPTVRLHDKNKGSCIGDQHEFAISGRPHPIEPDHTRCSSGALAGHDEFW